MTDPVNVRIMREPASKKDLARSVFMVAVPMLVMVLIQRPALRQAIIMRGCHCVKVLGDELSDLGNLISAKAATGYNKARL